MAQSSNAGPVEVGSSSVLAYQVCERVRETLFLVRSYFASGTGFLVHVMRPDGGRPFGIVATAHHVVEEALKARAEITLRHEGSGKIFIANPWDYGIARTGELDVAFCMISDENLPDMRVAEQGPPGKWLMPGSSVFWMGYPGLVEQYAARPVACVFTGIVSGAFVVPGPGNEDVAKRQTMYVLDGTVMRGCSGGPAFDEDGKVMGVVVAQGAERDDRGACLSPGVTLAIPLWEALREFMVQQIADTAKGGDGR